MHGFAIVSLVSAIVVTLTGPSATYAAVVGDWILGKDGAILARVNEEGTLQLVIPKTVGLTSDMPESSSSSSTDMPEMSTTDFPVPNVTVSAMPKSEVDDGLAVFIDMSISDDPRVTEVFAWFRDEISQLFTAPSETVGTNTSAVEDNSLTVFSQLKNFLRLNHLYRGYPVYSSQIIAARHDNMVALRKFGVFGGGGMYLYGIQLNLADYPELDAVAKGESVKADYLMTNQKVVHSDVSLARTIVFVDPSKGRGAPRLAYEVELTVVGPRGPSKPYAIIDAANGEVYKAYDNLKRG